MSDAWWTPELDQLDDIRRAVSVAVKGSQDMHPDRPMAKAIAAAEQARTAKRERAIDAARAREAGRQQRLANNEGGTE